MRVIIDNGHGSDTAGKCSPDKRLLEYKWAREVARAIKQQLEADGIPCELLVPEDKDIDLTTRCKRANNICKEAGGAGKCLLVSIHADAAGADGKWHSAGGWSAYTTRGVTKADELATELYNAAKEELVEYERIMAAGKQCGKYTAAQRPYRTDYTDGDADQEAGFYILQHTSCPAVLTENLFQDNESDVNYILSEAGRASIVRLHVKGIKRYIKSMEG